jgi:hypothetical protein
MKKVYIVKYDNGEEYPEEYTEFTFKYCYSTEEQAKKAVEELKQDKQFLLENALVWEEKLDNVQVWYEELELV